ncbi:MAG: hypothetical protein KAS86_05520 [Candidatus Omnitrophica bacterium]|nr:hypothetical protein [Candidatus Omnitrophota bacterium]
MHSAVKSPYIFSSPLLATFAHKGGTLSCSGVFLVNPLDKEPITPGLHELLDRAPYLDGEFMGLNEDQSMFVMVPDGSARLHLTVQPPRQDRVTSMSLMFRPGEKTEIASEVVFLPNYSFDTSADGERFLLVEDGVRILYGLPVSFSDRLSAQLELFSTQPTTGATAVKKAIPSLDDGETITFTLRGSEHVVEKVLTTLGGFLPDVQNALFEMSDDRRQGAKLSIAIGKGNTEEVYVEMQSRKGGVWAMTYLFDETERTNLMIFLEGISLKETTD